MNNILTRFIYSTFCYILFLKKKKKEEKCLLFVASNFSCFFTFAKQDSLLADVASYFKILT